MCAYQRHVVKRDTFGFHCTKYAMHNTALNHLTIYAQLHALRYMYATYAIALTSNVKISFG